MCDWDQGIAVASGGSTPSVATGRSYLPRQMYAEDGQGRFASEKFVAASGPSVRGGISHPLKALFLMKSLWESIPRLSRRSSVADQTKVQPEFKTVTVRNEGKQIVLPEKMTYATAIQWLRRRMEEDEREIGIHESIDCLPLEGAFYAGRALVNLFGFFDAAKYTDPTWVSLEVGFGKTEQVLWGVL